MAIQWGNNSALAGFQNALALGADIGGAIRQNREDGALAAFMTASNKPTGGAPVMGGMGAGIVATPEQNAESERMRAAFPNAPEFANDPRTEAYNRLAKINPRLAMQAQDRVAGQEAARAKLMQEQRAADLRTKAAQGDPAALQQLVGIDFDSWKALDANQRKLVADQNSYIGQSALRISQLPAEQQAAAWDQAIDAGVQSGYSALAAKRGKYSQQALTGAIDDAKLVGEFLKLAEPDWRVVPEGGAIVNARDPKAIASLSGGTSGGDLPKITSKADVDKLPPGAQFIAPDGSIKRKGGGVSNGTGGF